MRRKTSSYIYIFTMCAYTRIRTKIYILNLSLSLSLIYIYLCIIYILLKHHSDISCSQPTKESSFSFSWIFVRFKVFQWTARFCEKKVKAFKAGKLRSMKVSCANCESGGVSDCFGWFSDLWGDSPSTENPYYMGDLKISRKNSQQPTASSDPWS